MENLTLIQSEKIDSIHKELKEIKAILQNNNQEELLNAWLSKIEARKRLHVCQKTFDNYLSKGILPYARFAGKIYVKAADIEAHLLKHYIKAS